LLLITYSLSVVMLQFVVK